MRELIDLDAIVGELEPHPVKIMGKMYEADPDPDPRTLLDMIRVAQAADTDATETWDAVERVLTDIFGDSAKEIVERCGFVRTQALLAALFEAYAAEGKVVGSSRASRRTGGRSKPTSNASTGSTSAKPASGQNGSAALVSPA